MSDEHTSARANGSDDGPGPRRGPSARSSASAGEPPATLEDAGQLLDLGAIPRALVDGEVEPRERGHHSCCFCGVGDSGSVVAGAAGPAAAAEPGTRRGHGVLLAVVDGQPGRHPALLHEDGTLDVTSSVAVTAPGGVLSASLELGAETVPVFAREVERKTDDAGALVGQRFEPYRRALTVADSVLKARTPTAGCVKFKSSAMRQHSTFPIHGAPSVLEHRGGARRAVTYRAAIERFADLLLAHRAPAARTLVYACGQLDYFAIFAMQEVFRLLGIRNLTGNAEHCLNAGAVFGEMLTGTEAPLMTYEQAVKGPDRFYVMSGWNGFITHPPLFRDITRRDDLDGYLIDVVVTESARALAQRLDAERVVLVRPRSDPHLALAVAHELLAVHPRAIHARFLERFAEPGTFAAFAELAGSPRFEPGRVAERIAAEPGYRERVLKAIRRIAQKLAQPETVPILVSSMGLSQTSGVVAHCLWAGALAMLGKYGLRADGTLAGGNFRAAGQINAESEVQGLNRKYFMGRIRMDDAVEAARRMGLPDDAYEAVVRDAPRAALDYADPTPGTPELFLCFGTQFESNMMGRPRWRRKLEDPSTTLVVVDPVPDPFSVAQAELILPSPPHPATSKLYQNGEWKLSLSLPHKQPAEETRSDATILYDVMAEVTRRVEGDARVADQHPDLARHARSGYLRRRFVDPGPSGSPDAGLRRLDGEVSRPQLWRRILAYLGGGRGPLYCRPEHDDGRPIEWQELLEAGTLRYGGVGVRRGRLDYDDPGAEPFCDIYRRPRRFSFFTPTEDDLHLPEGIVLDSGRSCLSDEAERIRFAIATFNSGKSTPAVGMPDENPLHVSPLLADRHGLKTGDRVKVTGRPSGESIVMPVIVTDRAKGETVYASFHKSRAEMTQGRYLNDVTSHLGRCAYTSQAAVKASSVALERVERGPAEVAPAAARVAAPRLDTTLIDPHAELPIWSGQSTPLYVTDIVRETHDVFTYRFQGQPLCRFVYRPGQFCTLVLSIDGKKVVRSYTISSTPTRPFVLEITVKRVPGGLVSNWLADTLKVGDRIEVSGPRGKFCLMPGRVPPKILFVAAGSGITPLMAMSRWLCDVSAGVDVKVFNSVRSPDDIIFEKELDLMTTRYRMFEPMHVTSSRAGSRGWTGMTGRISRAMLELAVPDLHERHVYICGPEGFMGAAKEILVAASFDLARLHTESFGGVRTSVAEKSAPLGDGSAGAAASSAPAPAAAADLAVEFARSGKIARTDGRTPLLEVAEANDVDLEYGCRAGSCGDCKARLLKGEVEMASEDGLTPADKQAGYVLTCVARPRGPCTVDA